MKEKNVKEKKNNNKRNEWAEDASVWRLRVTLSSLYRTLANWWMVVRRFWFILRVSRFFTLSLCPAFARTLLDAIDARSQHSSAFSVFWLFLIYILVCFSLWTEIRPKRQTSGDDTIPSVPSTLCMQWDSNIIFFSFFTFRCSCPSPSYVEYTWEFSGIMLCSLVQQIHRNYGEFFFFFQQRWPSLTFGRGCQHIYRITNLTRYIFFRLDFHDGNWASGSNFLIFCFGTFWCRVSMPFVGQRQSTKPVTSNAMKENIYSHKNVSRKIVQ